MISGLTTLDANGLCIACIKRGKLGQSICKVQIVSMLSISY